jgi:hypothetical protein
MANALGEDVGKDIAKADIDTVAVEDVDTGQDVLESSHVSTAFDNIQANSTSTLTIRPVVAQVYFSDSAAPFQP